MKPRVASALLADARMRIAVAFWLGLTVACSDSADDDILPPPPEGEGIQLFETIEGDHFTIVGMPLLPLLAKLREMQAIDG